MNLIHYMYSTLLIILLSALSVSAVIGQDCNNDTTPPFIACLGNLNVELSTDGSPVVIQAATLVAFISDNCDSSPAITINFSSESTGEPSASTSIQLTEEGTFGIELWAVDASGNIGICWASIIVGTDETGECANETTPPVIACDADLNAVLPSDGSPITLLATDILAAVSDNCDDNPELFLGLPDQGTSQPPSTTSVQLTEPGTFQLLLWAVDASGNASFCWTWITVEGYDPNCENDSTPPTLVCSEGLSAQLPLNGSPLSIFAYDLVDSISDNCSAGTDLTVNLLSQSTGQPAQTNQITLDSAGVYPVQLWATDQAGNVSSCNTTLYVAQNYYRVSGYLFADANTNCSPDSGEAQLSGVDQIIRAIRQSTGQVVETAPRPDGSFVLALPWPADSLNDIRIEWLLSEGFSTSCTNSILYPTLPEGGLQLPVPVPLTADCNYLTVDISAPFLRRCFSNTGYIHYSNYANFPVEGAYILVQLDEYMDFQSASLQTTHLGNGLYRLELGTLPAGSSGMASLQFMLSCAAPLGLTHCIDATLEPFDCEQANFAELVVTGQCHPSSNEVVFTITNVGNSDMAAPQNAMIVEDVVMYMQQDPIILEAGAHQSFSFPANGATWRFEVPQDSSFPWGGLATDFVENCGGFSEEGLPTQLPLNVERPNAARSCQQNIGAWDPNDKQAFPSGYLESHYLTANTPLEYVIRFQNTGSDTAFNIRIEDQLSPLLDEKTIEIGASSHPCRMTLNENRQLAFFFDDIMLPDSAANLEASQGFVKFQIRQRPDLPDGSRIENTAAIFFDFNEPVITNTVFHTIGSNFILVGATQVASPDLHITLSPNPLQTSALLTLQGAEHRYEQLACTLYDAQGRQLKQMAFQDNQLTLSRTDFGSSGLYFYAITANGRQLAQGKLHVQ